MFAYSAAMSADVFANMSDTEVLERACEALRKVQAYPAGTVERAIRWMVYESAKAELDLRLARHILAKLREAN